MSCVFETYTYYCDVCLIWFYLYHDSKLKTLLTTNKVDAKLNYILKVSLIHACSYLIWLPWYWRITSYVWRFHKASWSDQSSLTTYPVAVWSLDRSLWMLDHRCSAAAQNLQQTIMIFALKYWCNLYFYHSISSA